MKFHFWSGYAILTLLLFRIAWGFVGSTTARFSDFVKGPSAAFGHLRELRRRRRAPTPATIPLGGAMVVVLIFAVLAQVVAGLFSADTDTGMVTGPLSGLVADKWIDKRRRPSTLTGSTCCWSWPALHVLAAIVYLVWKRQNLIGAMIHGHKPIDDVVPPGQPAPRAALSPRAGSRSRC